MHVIHDVPDCSSVEAQAIYIYISINSFLINSEEDPSMSLVEVLVE